MATTFTKVLLSGSSAGKSIRIPATGATPGSVVHTAVSGTTSLDEIWTYAVNTGGAASKLTLEWGGTVDPFDHIEVTVPSESGLMLITPGLLMNNGSVVQAYSGTAGTVTLYGYVNRIV